MSFIDSATSSWPLSIDVDVYRRMSMSKRRKIYMALTPEQRTNVISILYERERLMVHPPGSIVTYRGLVVVVLATDQVPDNVLMGVEIVETRMSNVRLIWSSKYQTLEWVDVDWLKSL